MDNRKWVYLLLASTVAGFGLGELELGPAQAAVPIEVSRYAEKDPVGSTGIATIEAFAMYQLCADAQIKLGITEEQCTIEMICAAGILLECYYNDALERLWKARSFKEMKAIGNFTPDEPQ